MITSILSDLEAGFQKTNDALTRELARIRTGRANANLLDNIMVSYYGQLTPLSQVAGIQVPEPRLITIKPWEQSLLKDIERAILQSDLGITPSNDGNLIRLSIPPLTEDRRKALVKQVNACGEEAKVATRNQRRDANATAKSFQKDGDITEDDLEKALKKIQEKTDAAIAKIEKLISAKEAELMEI